MHSLTAMRRRRNGTDSKEGQLYLTWALREGGLRIYPGLRRISILTAFFAALLFIRAPALARLDAYLRFYSGDACYTYEESPTQDDRLFPQEVYGAQLLDAVRTWTLLADMQLSLSLVTASKSLEAAYSIFTWARSHQLISKSVKDEFNNLGSSIANTALKKGIQELKNGSYAIAQHSFRISVCSSPIAPAYLGMALSLLRMEGEEKAREYFLYGRRIYSGIIDSISSLSLQDCKTRTPFGLSCEALSAWASIKGYESAPMPSLKCGRYVAVPAFSGSSRRNIAVVYAHAAPNRTRNLAVEQVFRHEMEMIYYAAIALGNNVVKGSLDDCLEEKIAYFHGCSRRQLVIFSPPFLSLDSALEARLPHGAVLAQSEQLMAAESGWITPDYIKMLSSGKYQIWDYSSTNRKYLIQTLGLKQVNLLPYGYVPQLSIGMPVSIYKDIDILFFGALHERRFAVLRELEAMGYKCVFMHSLYDADRDFMLSRAKVILNIHYYSSEITETNRLMLSLLVNAVVISENGADPEDDEMWKEAGVIFVEYSKIVPTVSHVINTFSEDIFQSRSPIPAMLKWPFFSRMETLLAPFNDQCLSGEGSRIECVQWP